MHIHSLTHGYARTHTSFGWRCWSTGKPQHSTHMTPHHTHQPPLTHPRTHRGLPYAPTSHTISTKPLASDTSIRSYSSYYTWLNLTFLYLVAMRLPFLIRLLYAYLDLEPLVNWFTPHRFTPHNLDTCGSSRELCKFLACGMMLLLPRPHLLL